MQLPKYDVNDSETCRSFTELHLYVSRMHLLVSQIIYLFWDNVAVPSSRVKKPQILLDISNFPDESTKLSQNAGHKLSSNMAPHTWRTENGPWISSKIHSEHDMISGYSQFLFEWTHIKNTTPKRHNEKYYIHIILSSNFQFQVMDQTHEYDIINHLICAFMYYLYPNLAYYFIQTSKCS